MIEAKIIKDSIAPSGVRLTTFVLTYPRFIHSEFMTHRVFSRNASSSRALPVSRQIDAVIENPAIPLAFTKNKAGMQGGELLTGEEHALALKVWLGGRDAAVVFAKNLADLKVHKQYANRVLEPYAHISVVCTATKFINFFALRYHEMAQPEICELAKKMYDIYEKNQPQSLRFGQWHLPFIDGCESDLSGNSIKQSVARCARVSYLTHEGKEPTLEEDLALYDRLLGHLPIHASPAEHQAMACLGEFKQSGNIHGWLQYRKTLDNENVSEFKKPNF